MAVFCAGVTIPKNFRLASDVELGSSVFLDVDGEPVEFLVINQGNPDPTMYGAGCDGMWIITKDIYTSLAFNNDTKTSNYAETTIRSWLNYDFMAMLDEKVAAAVQTAHIPVGHYDSGWKLITCADKAFLISMLELDEPPNPDAPLVVGTALDYFEGSTSAMRAATYNGGKLAYYTRTPYNSTTSINVHCITTAGNNTYSNPTIKYGIRPVLILPADSRIGYDGSFLGYDGPDVNFVEYIESTGTQYIDTGFKHNQDTRVVMNAQLTETVSGVNSWLFEGRSAANSSGAGKGLFFYNTSTGKWSCDYSGSTSRLDFDGIGATDRLSIDYNKNVCTINGVTVTHSPLTFQSTYSIYLLSDNKAGAASGTTKAKLYSCQIYDNGNLVRDYRPCLDPDGVACLYDMVAKEYVYNAGSGNFTAGGAA